jgi:hypothetical protein
MPTIFQGVRLFPFKMIDALISWYKNSSQIVEFVNGKSIYHREFCQI